MVGSLGTILMVADVFSKATISKSTSRPLAFTSTVHLASKSSTFAVMDAFPSATPVMVPSFTETTFGSLEVQTILFPSRVDSLGVAMSLRSRLSPTERLIVSFSNFISEIFWGEGGLVPLSHPARRSETKEKTPTISNKFLFISGTLIHLYSSL